MKYKREYVIKDIVDECLTTLNLSDPLMGWLSTQFDNIDCFVMEIEKNGSRK